MSLTPKQWILVTDAILTLVSTVITLKVAQGPDQAIYLSVIATIGTIIPVLLGYSSEKQVVMARENEAVHNRMIASLTHQNTELQLALETANIALAAKDVTGAVGDFLAREDKL